MSNGGAFARNNFYRKKFNDDSCLSSKNLYSITVTHFLRQNEETVEEVPFFLKRKIVRVDNCRWSVRDPVRLFHGLSKK